jgi:hypothetical protein
MPGRFLKEVGIYFVKTEGTGSASPGKRSSILRARLQSSEWLKIRKVKKYELTPDEWSLLLE